MNLPYSLIGGTGVHHVVSELSRRGFAVLPTVRNVAAYDVIAATLETSLKRVNDGGLDPLFSRPVLRDIVGKLLPMSGSVK